MDITNKANYMLILYISDIENKTSLKLFKIENNEFSLIIIYIFHIVSFSEYTWGTSLLLVCWVFAFYKQNYILTLYILDIENKTSLELWNIENNEFSLIIIYIFIIVSLTLVFRIYMRRQSTAIWYMLTLCILFI